MLGAAPVPPGMRPDDIFVVQRRQSDGSNELRAYARSGLAGWSVAVAPPSRPRATRVPVPRMPVLDGALLVLSLVLAIYFGRRLAFPFRAAVLATASLRPGTTGPGRSEDPVEADELLDALQVASRRRQVAEEELRQARDRLASVMRELTHRSKNLLAIIQAMARRTALLSDSLDDFEARFSGRLQSLSRSHELLIATDWEGAALGDLVEVQRGAFGPHQARIRASGPRVFLRPEATLNIGLALHELASNAERHGTFATSAGRVDLNWSVEELPEGSRRLLIAWRERGRLAAGSLVTRGFGRDILEHVAPTALNAKVVLRPAPGGLLWSLEVPGEQFAHVGQATA